MFKRFVILFVALIFMLLSVLTVDALGDTSRCWQINQVRTCNLTQYIRTYQPRCWSRKITIKALGPKEFPYIYSCPGPQPKIVFLGYNTSR